MDETEFGRQRDRLVGLLDEVAELEHALCCSYLFAACSLKQQADDGASWSQVEAMRVWKGTLLTIARQEMEHLAIAANLLTAIGEAPYLRRPDFPTGSRYYPNELPIGLHAFSARVLGDFLLYELPQHVTADERDFRDWLEASPLEDDRRLAQRFAAIRKAATPGIETLYAEVESLLDALGRSASPRLFVGPREAQVGNAAVFSSLPATPDNVRVYDVLVATVTDRDSALNAVRQIRQEGEGSPSPQLPGGGHFARFMEMVRELSALRRADAGFVPGRAVVPNPRTAARADEMPEQAGVTIVTHPFSRAVVELHDRAYEVLLRMLVRFFLHTDEGQPELQALQGLAFFPMMTLAMRPLGDMLTQLPAFANADDPARAGPSFQCPRRVDFLPHGPAAWRVLHGQLLELRGRAKAIADDPRAPPALQPRLQLLYENFWRMAYNFATATGLEEAA